MGVLCDTGSGPEEGSASPVGLAVGVYGGEDELRYLSDALPSKVVPRDSTGVVPDGTGADCPPLPRRKSSLPPLLP